MLSRPLNGQRNKGKETKATRKTNEKDTIINDTLQYKNNVVMLLLLCYNVPLAYLMTVAAIGCVMPLWFSIDTLSELDLK